MKERKGERNILIDLWNVFSVRSSFDNHQNTPDVCVCALFVKYHRCSEYQSECFSFTLDITAKSVVCFKPEHFNRCGEYLIKSDTYLERKLSSCSLLARSFACWLHRRFDRSLSLQIGRLSAIRRLLMIWSTNISGHKFSNQTEPNEMKKQNTHKIISPRCAHTRSDALTRTVISMSMLWTVK